MSSPTTPKNAPPSFLSMVAALFGLSTLISAYTAGLAGTAIAWKLGPSLAMVLRMYGGEPEPVRPEPWYPWGAAVLLALVPLPLAWKRRWTLAGLVAVPVAIVPLVWALWRMYGAAAPT